MVGGGNEAFVNGDLMAIDGGGPTTATDVKAIGGGGLTTATLFGSFIAALSAASYAASSSLLVRLSAAVITLAKPSSAETRTTLAACTADTSATAAL